MGTDPAQANVLQTRQVQIPGFLDLQPARDLGERWKCKNLPAYSTTNMPFSIALMIVVDKVSQKWLKDNNVKEPAISELWGQRSNCPNPDATPEKPLYRARPLNGVWATAPYIHNGSVPSLYWMLKPQAERPQQFCLGARDFDPRDVGFRVAAGGDKSCKTGETMFMDDGKQRQGDQRQQRARSFAGGAEGTGHEDLQERRDRPHPGRRRAL